MDGLPGSSDLRQCALDPRAMRLEEAGKLELFAEMLDGLVDRESRPVGRDLEQHTAGLAEVDRPEVAAVALLGDGESVVVREH